MSDMDMESSSPQDSLPTSPGFQTDPAKNVAVDYIKARYEGGVKPKDPAAAIVPKVFREPKKLDFQWDKIVDENTKKETGLPAGFKEQDLLQMVFTCMGVDTKSQYLSAVDSQQPAAKDERSKAEIESLPEITKSVRQMFESGNIVTSTEKSAAETSEEIQRGSAKSLLNQWNQIGIDGTTTTTSGPPCMKPTYELAPGSGVFENQPATLDGVVRASDQTDEQVIQRGLTRSLLGQWNTMGSGGQDNKPAPNKNGPSKFKPTYEKSAGSGVFENEPTRLEGVVRENDDAVEGEQIQRGYTKSLLSQWQNKGTEEQKYPTKRPIRIAEAEGRIAENEPVRRTDVVRADDTPSSEGEQVRRGHAKSLVSEWKTKGKEEFVAERKIINVAEGEGKVLESEPVRRSDVVREDDPSAEEGEQIQRGTTRMLLDQWKNIGTATRQYSSKERTPIILTETDGRVVENEPAPRRTDIAREDNPGVSEGGQIQCGMARSLMNQWKSIGSVDAVNYRKERTPINVNEGEGKVLENEPVRRTDVVRADDENFEEVKIQRGTTRNLLSQWKNKSNDDFRSSRKSIILDEDEGRIAENEPEARRTDVAREDYAEGEQVERGLAKNRLSQWQNKATEQYKVEKKPIVLAEGEGYVAENEPTEQRSDVIREDDSMGEQVQRGITKSLLSQWKTIGTEEYKQPKRTIVLAEGEERIAENEPVKRTDVVRADDVIPGDQPQVKRGMTKSLLNQWKTKGTEDVRTERKPIILAEDEGRILESEPVRLQGVVRADDSTNDEVVLQRGTTKSLLNQWKNKPNEETKLERRPIVLAEGEGTVAENEPAVQRQDVVRASAEYVPDEQVVSRGFARNLREQWINKGTEEFHKERTPIILNEAEGKIAENDPIRRTDVVRADDDDGVGGEPLVQRGTTKSLLNRWSGANFDMEVRSETRKPIVVAEDEGRILENEPVRRDDVVHADDNPDGNGGILVKRGLAKSLANEWKAKGSEEFVIERKAINVCEGEGSVSENEPVRRDDVFREDFDVEQERIQKGLTKSLLGQWKKIGTEDVIVERKPIVLAEGEGKVVESEPIRRNDVVHCDDIDSSSEVVSKGLTKNLLNQWVTKGSEEYVAERRVISLTEGEGRVAENEPVIRTDIIRENSELETVNIQRGIAKSLAHQWKHKAEEEYTIEKKPIILAEAEGRVVENEPTVRSDLIRENDSFEDVLVQRGLAKSMATQWKHKGEEVFKIERAPIVVAEGEGKVVENEPEVREGVVRADDVMFEGESIVAENEPVRREDVFREDAYEPSTELPERGKARQLRAQWSSIGVAGSPSVSSRDVTPKPMISLFDESAAGSGIIENQPAPRRDDVIREDDEIPGDESILLRRGHARDMAGYWATARDDGHQLLSKERLELETLRQSGAWASGTDAEGAVFENVPVRLEGVVRANDPIDETLQIERGVAKNLATNWQNRRDDGGSRQPFRLELDVDPNATSVFENVPVQLEGVVRSSEPVNEVLGLQGQIRNIAQRYVALPDNETQSSKKTPEIIKLDLADGPSVLENVPAPVDPSVVRSDDYEPDMLKVGVTKNMRERWQSQRDLEGATGAGPGFGAKPAWQIELEMTPAGSGVFENEPLVRKDVIREEDRDPDMIPVRQTRKTRALWTRRERDEMEGTQQVEAGSREMVRFTPPRERTPPIVGLDEPYKSIQRITLLSSGSSTPARDQTPTRSSTTGQSGQSSGRQRSRPTSTSAAAAAMQSPTQSQPSTPGTMASQMSWTPSPAEAARSRAQITNEVMQWHARKMSRSVSIDDNQSSTSQPVTPSIESNGGDWGFQQHQQQQQQQQGEQSYQLQQENHDEPYYNSEQQQQFNDNSMTNSYDYQYYDEGVNSNAGVEHKMFDCQPLPDQQSYYQQDSDQWASYTMASPDSYQYSSDYQLGFQQQYNQYDQQQQQQPELSSLDDDVQYPVTVKSSATVVFRPASNGL